MLKVILVLIVAGGVQSQTPSDAYNYVCSFVDSLDCQAADFSPICANNGVEYKTECDFTKAHCKDLTLDVAINGPCGSQATTAAPTAAPTATKTTAAGGTNAPAGQTTTPSSASPTPTMSIVCQALMGQVCPADNSSVCASNFVSYDSLCEYTKARCLDPTLTVLYSGTCLIVTTTPPPASVFDIICKAISSTICYDDGIILCGSNNITYGNSCDFEKARCQDTTLMLAHSGPCPHN